MFLQQKYKISFFGYYTDAFAILIGYDVLCWKTQQLCVCVYYTFCPVFVYANNMKVQVETTSINSQNSFDWRNAFHTESGISFLSCQDMYVWTIAFWWKFKDKHTFSWEKIDFGSVSRDKIYQILYKKYGDTRDSWQLVWETYIVTWLKKCVVFWDKLRTKILATSFYNFFMHVHGYSNCNQNAFHKNVTPTNNFPCHLFSRKCVFL